GLKPRRLSNGRAPRVMMTWTTPRTSDGCVRRLACALIVGMGGEGLCGETAGTAGCGVGCTSSSARRTERSSPAPPTNERGATVGALGLDRRPPDGAHLPVLTWGVAPRPPLHPRRPS